MSDNREKINVYLESGNRRTFAGAVDWPGWCRSGHDETLALKALSDYGPRYERVLGAAGIDFRAPAGPSDLVVRERLEGNAVTDYGAPDAAPASDEEPLDENGRQRFQSILEACWMAFDAAIAAAAGKELRKGPRGGGRELEAIVKHVADADEAYLGRVGQKPSQDDLAGIRQAILDALAAGVRGELPREGPRGGTRWPARYFVRRVAWHVLDHAWEIEDRILE